MQQPYNNNTPQKPQSAQQQVEPTCHNFAQIPQGPQRRRRCHPSPHWSLRYGAAGEAGGLPEGPPPPPGPQGRRRRHPSRHSCATARRGRPVAYPKGRPNPRRTPRAAPVPPLATLPFAARSAPGRAGRPGPRNNRGGLIVTPRVHSGLTYPTARARLRPPLGRAGGSLEAGGFAPASHEAVRATSLA